MVSWLLLAHPLTHIHSLLGPGRPHTEHSVRLLSVAVAVVDHRYNQLLSGSPSLPLSFSLTASR